MRDALDDIRQDWPRLSLLLVVMMAAVAYLILTGNTGGRLRPDPVHYETSTPTKETEDAKGVYLD
jgi:hypothetical protein